MSSAMPGRVGVLPKWVSVRPPVGYTATLLRCAHCSTAATSSAFSGRTAATGMNALMA